MTDSLIAYDLQSLNDYLEEVSRDNDIEVVSAYRRYQSTFLARWLDMAAGQYLPTSYLFKDLVQKEYNRVGYKRYPDGIYLDLIYPVFSDGRLVGLLQFMRSYNNDFFQRYASLYNIDYAMISKNALMFNSKESTNSAIQQLLTEYHDEKRRKFRSGSSTYSVLVVPFNLGGDASGNMILYTERANLFSGESNLIQRLLAMTLLCVMIPVVTFFIKELRLIKVINSLLDATDSISSGNYNSRVDVISHDEFGTTEQ